jgi:hypothetical protein
MIFSVVYSADPLDIFAPYQILLDGEPFLDGIEFEEEAHAICALLVDLPATPPKSILPKHPTAGTTRNAHGRFVPVDVARLEIVHPEKKPHPLDPPEWHERWHRQQRERGSILIEAAIIIPLFCMLSFAGLDCVWAMQEKSTVTWLAQQAAVCSIVTPPGACVPQTLVLGQAAGMGLAPARLQLTAASGSATVTYQTQSLTGFFPSLTLTASATAVAP